MVPVDSLSRFWVGRARGAAPSGHEPVTSGHEWPHGLVCCVESSRRPEMDPRGACAGATPCAQLSLKAMAQRVPLEVPDFVLGDIRVPQAVSEVAQLLLETGVCHRQQSWLPHLQSRLPAFRQNWIRCPGTRVPACLLLWGCWQCPWRPASWMLRGPWAAPWPWGCGLGSSSLTTVTPPRAPSAGLLALGGRWLILQALGLVEARCGEQLPRSLLGASHGHAAGFCDMHYPWAFAATLVLECSGHLGDRDCQGSLPPSRLGRPSGVSAQWAPVLWCSVCPHLASPSWVPCAVGAG